MNKFITIFVFMFFAFTTQVVEAANGAQGHLTYNSAQECADEGMVGDHYHPVVAQQVRPVGAEKKPLLQNVCILVTVAASEVGDVDDLRKNNAGIQRYVFVPNGGRVWDVGGRLYMDGCFNTIFEVVPLGGSSEKTAAQTAPAPQSPVQRTEHYERHDHVYRDERRSSDLASLGVQQRWTSDNTDTLIVEVNKTARTLIRWSNGRKMVRDITGAWKEYGRSRGPRKPDVHVSFCNGNNSCNTNTTDVIALLEVQGPPGPQGPAGPSGGTTIITTPTTPTTPVATLPRERPSEPVLTRPRPPEPNSGGNTGTSGLGPRTNPGPANTGGTVITPLVPRPRPSDPNGG